MPLKFGEEVADAKHVFHRDGDPFIEPDEPTSRMCLEQLLTPAEVLRATDTATVS